jgi:hypothetical protein
MLIIDVGHSVICLLYDRYENWAFVFLVEMYALCEIFPTLIILLHISKFRLFSTSSSSSSGSPTLHSSAQSSSKPVNGSYGTSSSHSTLPMETHTLPNVNSRLLPSLNRSALSNPNYQSIPQQA